MNSPFLSNGILLCLIGVSAGMWNQTLLDTSYRVCGRKIEFPSPETKNLLKNAGKFISRNIIFTRFQFHGNNMYITAPRFKSGVPSTLSKVYLGMMSDYDSSTSAYPNWASQEEGNCNAIQSAVDLFLDKNQVLWVLDAGIRLNLETPDTKCPPKVLAISTLTHRVTRTISLSSLVIDSSNLQYLTVENFSGGDDFIYISDAGGKAIIVFNAGTGKGKRFSIPEYINTACQDSSALYLALIRKNNNNNFLYFTYAACNNIYSISTTALTRGEPTATIDFVGNTTSPVLFLGTDGQTKLYFREKQKPEVYVWDTNAVLPSEGWKKVWSGEPERVATHVTNGPYKIQWILESNFGSFVANSTGRLGDCSKISPLTGILD